MMRLFDHVWPAVVNIAIMTAVVHCVYTDGDTRWVTLWASIGVQVLLARKVAAK